MITRIEGGSATRTETNAIIDSVDMAKLNMTADDLDSIEGYRWVAEGWSWTLLVLWLEMVLSHRPAQLVGDQEMLIKNPL